jgi:hypothetical protein
MEDGLRTGVESSRRELGAELEDGVDYGLVDLVATGGWAVGLRLKGSGSLPSIACKQLIEPTARDRVLTNELIRALFA